MVNKESYPKILFKYLIKNHLMNLILIFSIFFILIFFIDLIELYRRSENKINYGELKEISFRDLILMSFLKGPNVMQKILPLTILIGSIITFIKWRQNNYFIIIRTVGISLWKLILPICTSVLVIGVLSILFLNPISSILNKKFNDLENNFFGHRQIPQFSLGTQGLWLLKKNDDTTFIINANKINQNKNILKKINVFKFDNGDNFVSKIIAEAAKYENGSLELIDGTVFSRKKEPNTFNSLLLLTDKKFEKIKILTENPEHLDVFSLYNYINLMSNSGLNLSNHIIYFLKILSLPILMVSMVLISASLILRNNERKFPLAIISLTLIVGFVIYFVADLVLALGSMEKLNPFLAGLGPSMLSFFSGCFLVSSFDESK